MQSQEPAKTNSVFFWGFLFREQQQPVPKLVKQLEGKGIVRVAAGGFYFLCLSGSGELFGWGITKYSRFAISEPDSLPIPRKIPLKQKVTEIAAGNWHSLIVDDNAKAYAVGHNKHGACGLGHFNNTDSFTECLFDSEVSKVSAGERFSALITKSNQLYTCGLAAYHGHKKEEHLNKFQKLALDNIAVVSAGFTHTLAASIEGELYFWGKSLQGQIKQPKKVKELEGVKIVAVSCSRGEKHSHSMVVDSEGRLYTWGSGYKGKLGHQSEWSHADAADELVPRQVKTLEDKVVIPSAGGIHSNILNQKGEVLSFGCGSDGRLGHIESTDHKYLYRQGYPRVIETLKGYEVVDLASSYYQNICLGFRR